MDDLLAWSVEYKNWGWNATTIGSLGTVIFTVFEAWGLLKQNQSIWRNRSGASVAVSLYSVQMFGFAAFTVYGFYIRGLAAIFNGLVLTVLHAPILLGLWRFKGFSRFEKVEFCVASLMVPAVLVLPWKEELFFTCSLWFIYSLFTQLRELWIVKRRGVVDIRLFLVYIASTAFWAIYAFAVDAWALQVLTSVNLTQMCVIAALWTSYPAGESRVS